MPHLDHGRIDDVICNPISTAGYCGLCQACRARTSELGEAGPDRLGEPNSFDVMSSENIFKRLTSSSPGFQTVVNWSARDLWMLEEDPDKRPYIWDLP